MMKKTRLKHFIALCFVSVLSCSCYAEPIDIGAFSAVEKNIKMTEEASLIKQPSCPKNKNNKTIYSYEDQQQHVIEGDDMVYLITLGVCWSSSSTKSQFLVVRKNGRYHVKDDIGLRIGSFYANSIAGVQGRNVKLTGDKWEEDDSNCCPSKTSALIYNLDNGEHRFVDF